MIRHHDIRPQFDVWEMLRDGLPTLIGDLALRGEVHGFVIDLPEQAGTVLRDDGDVIRARSCVIVGGYADRSAIVGVAAVQWPFALSNFSASYRP